MITTGNDETASKSPQLVADIVVYFVAAFAAVQPIVHALHRHFFIEPDSVGYMSLGANLWHGRGFADFSGDWCSDWPPFYPLVVGLCQFLEHGNSILAFGIVGGICLSTTLLFANAWLKKITKSALVRCAVIIALSVSVPLTNLANSGLSESLFVPLSIAGIYFTGCCLDNGKKIYFTLAANSALLCCLTRYVGVCMVGAVVVALLFSPSVKLSKRIVHALTFVLATLIPFLTWCVINKYQTGTFMGDREPGSNSLHDCLAALFNCLRDSLVQPSLTVILCGGACLGLVVWICTRKESSYPYMRTAPIFAILYAATIVWSSAKYNIDMIDDRLTVPLFVPLIITAVGSIDYLRSSVIKPAARMISVGIAVFFLLVAFESRTVAQIPDGGYLSAQWQRSRTLAYVARASFSDPMYSNDSAATWLLSGKLADWVADDSDTPTMPDVENDINALPGPFTLVWLYNAIEPANFDPTEICAKCNVQMVEKFDDGAIFQRISASH